MSQIRNTELATKQEHDMMKKSENNKSFLEIKKIYMIDKTSIKIGR